MSSARFCPKCGAELQIGFGSLGHDGHGVYRYCFNHDVWPWCSYVAKGLGAWPGTQAKAQRRQLGVDRLRTKLGLP